MRGFSVEMSAAKFLLVHAPIDSTENEKAPRKWQEENSMTMCPGSVGQLSVGWSGGWNAVRASGRLSLPKGEGRVRVY